MYSFLEKDMQKFEVRGLHKFEQDLLYHRSVNLATLVIRGTHRRRLPPVLQVQEAPITYPLRTSAPNG